MFTPHINTNDCWNLVLSRVLKRDYESVRQEMIERKCLDPDGSLPRHHASLMLKEVGYIEFNLLGLNKYGNVTVRKILEEFYSNSVVIGSYSRSKDLYHISYGYEGVDYTTSESDESMDDPVIILWIRPNF